MTCQIETDDSWKHIYNLSLVRESLPDSGPHDWHPISISDVYLNYLTAQWKRVVFRVRPFRIPD